MNDAALDRLFFALSDPTRRALLLRLAQGPAIVGELAAPHAMTAAAISKHLKVLSKAGLLQRDKRSQWVHCTLEPLPLAQALAWLSALTSDRTASSPPAPPLRDGPHSRFL